MVYYRVLFLRGTSESIGSILVPLSTVTGIELHNCRILIREHQTVLSCSIFQPLLRYSYLTALCVRESRKQHRFVDLWRIQKKAALKHFSRLQYILKDDHLSSIDAESFWMLLLCMGKGKNDLG